MPLSSTFISTTSSLSIKTVPVCLIQNIRLSTISLSANGRILCFFSTSVTFTPRQENTHAYSHPMTPPPIIVRVEGMLLSSSMVSLSWICSESNGMSEGLAGLLPAARTITPAGRGNSLSPGFLTRRGGGAEKSPLLYGGKKKGGLPRVLARRGSCRNPSPADIRAALYDRHLFTKFR